MSETEILTTEEVGDWQRVAAFPISSGVNISRQVLARFCLTIEHYAKAAQAGPTREICSECWKLSAVGFHVPDDIWRSAIPEGRQEDIFCIACFAHFADRAYLAWDKDIQFFSVSKRTHREFAQEDDAVDLEELRLLRAWEAAERGTDAAHTEWGFDASLRVRDEARADLDAFRARQKT